MRIACFFLRSSPRPSLHNDWRLGGTRRSCLSIFGAPTPRFRKEGAFQNKLGLQEGRDHPLPGRVLQVEMTRERRASSFHQTVDCGDAHMADIPLTHTTPLCLHAVASAHDTAMSSPTVPHESGRSTAYEHRGAMSSGGPYRALCEPSVVAPMLCRSLLQRCARWEQFPLSL